MKLELFKMLQTRTRFFLIYHTKRLCYFSGHSAVSYILNTDREDSLDIVTSVQLQTQAPAQKSTFFPKFNSLSNHSFYFYPRQLQFCCLQSYNDTKISVNLNRSAPKLPLPMQVPGSTTRNEAADFLVSDFGQQLFSKKAFDEI